MIHTDNNPIKYITPRESMELCRSLAVDQLTHLREAKASAFGYMVADDLIERTERIIKEWDARLNVGFRRGDTIACNAGLEGPKQEEKHES